MRQKRRDNETKLKEMHHLHPIGPTVFTIEESAYITPMTKSFKIKKIYM